MQFWLTISLCLISIDALNFFMCFYQALGIMGALDPLMHKRNQLILPGSHGQAAPAAGYSGHHIRHLDEVMMDNCPSFATCETYCSLVGYRPEKKSRFYCVEYQNFCLCGLEILVMFNPDANFMYPSCAFYCL